ncbi:MAG: PASTA domain-containing protein [Bacteroidales bacterium]|nr:PASTA domain-containing protein [Bacteroidales bacterium]
MKGKSFFSAYPVLASLIMMLVISLVIVFIAIKGTNLITHHGKEVPAPDLVGQTIEDVALIDDFEIMYSDSIFSPDVAAGTILSQDPSAGTNVKKGRKIYVTIATSVPPKVEMPNLLDLSLRQAGNLLKTNDLKLGQVIYKASKYNNVVLEQRYKGRIIAAGAKIPYQSEITLIVGKAQQEQLLEENE